MVHRPRLSDIRIAPLDAAARADSLRRTLADENAVEPLWLFAYGSMIWNPCFTAVEHRPATLRGFRRAFNLWTVRARGTPENPGLVLGLEAGGSCEGIVYRLAEDTRAQDLDAIWWREMFASLYEPRWLRTSTPQGPQTALAFVTRADSAQYAGYLNAQEAAEVIALAQGVNGTCRDYLEQTVTSLAQYGIVDRYLSGLLGSVDGPLPVS